MLIHAKYRFAYIANVIKECTVFGRQHPKNISWKNSVRLICLVRRLYHQKQAPFQVWDRIYWRDGFGILASYVWQKLNLHIICSFPAPPHKITFLPAHHTQWKKRGCLSIVALVRWWRIGWGTSRRRELLAPGPSRSPCCVLLALSWNTTNENPSTDKLSRAINRWPHEWKFWAQNTVSFTPAFYMSKV